MLEDWDVKLTVSLCTTKCAVQRSFAIIPLYGEV